MFDFLTKKHSKKSDEIIINFENIGIDFHSHLLPRVDDGVQNIEDTIIVLKNLKSLGYRKILTSPHIMGEKYLNTKSELFDKFETILSNDEVKNIGLELGIIAEYLLDEQFEDLLKKNDFLTFGEKHILIETSMNYEFPFVKDYIFELNKLGYKPILAHPERYRYIFNEKDYIDQYEGLKDLGVLFQLNLFSLIGLYGDKSKTIAEELINLEMYELVSSDIHTIDQLKFFEPLKKSFYLKKLIDSPQFINKEFI